MKKLFLLLLFITQITFGQSNIIEISTTGSGETKEEAVQNALLSALKQSFGVFISSNTEIINDVLTKDKISELSSGDILEYNIISETENGDYYNTLVLSKISINTLTSYTKNKVDSNEISGDVFVSNFLIKELNKENELQSIKDLIEYSKKVLPSGLDYYIDSNDPVSSESVNYDFYIETKIGFKPNENYTIWKDHFNTTIQNISLSEREYLTYKKQKIKTFPIVLNSELYYLRNRESLINLFEFSLNKLENTFNFNINLNGLDRTIVVKDQIKNDSKGSGFIYENSLECEIVEGKVVKDSKEYKFSGLPLVTLHIPPRTYSQFKINDYMNNTYSLSIEKYEFQAKKNRIYNILKREIEEKNNPLEKREIEKKNNPPKIPKNRIYNILKGGESITQDEFDRIVNFYSDDARNQTTDTNNKRVLELESLKLLIVDEKTINVNDEISLKSTNSFNDLLNQKLLKYFPDKYGAGIGGPYYYVLAIQTNYIKPGYHKINIQMNLEDLKKFRGFQITNSN